MSTAYMVETQIKPRGVVDAQVLRAMRTVPRDLFVPDEYRDFAFSDCPLPLSDGQTISQPYMVAAMTEYLQLDKHSKVLEIGTGCGYQTAVLAEIAKVVYTVEIIPVLGKGAERRLATLNYDNINFRIGDGFFGWPEHAPYDGILVAAAPEAVPPPLLEQLAPGGRMIIPVGPIAECQNLEVIEKTQDGKIRRNPVMPVRFVPLTRN